MSASEPPRHPLFDLASTYSRMHQSARPEYKMRGYFHWQKARAIRLGLPLDQDKERREIDLHNLACHLADEDSPEFRITDAIDVAPVCLPQKPWLDGRPTGSLFLGREAEGTHTVGMWVKLDEKEACPSVPCRAFLIEPEVLVRFREVVQKSSAVDLGNLLAHAFAPETVGCNMGIARLLAAIPDLDGEVRGRQIHFHRLPIASEFTAFPPRQGPLTVVLVCGDLTTAQSW